MNQKMLMAFKNSVANKLETSSRGHRNCYRYNSGSNKMHEDMKYEIFKYLRGKGIEVVVEAEFKNKTGRADILVLDWDIAIEVLYSEVTGAAIKNKKYPVKEIVEMETGESLYKQIEHSLAWRI